nr:protein NETWORKED 4B-like isoform X2 [Coffea arabica]
MDKVESKSSDLVWCNGEIRPFHPHCLAKNVEGVDQKIKQMAEIIEQVGDLPADKPEIKYQNRLQLIALLEEISQGHQLLAQQYDHLLENRVASLAHQDSSMLTPDHKLGKQKTEQQPVAFTYPLSSGSSSSNVSGKEGSQFSSLSSDSDSESSNASPKKCSSLNLRNSGQMQKGEYVVKESGISEYGLINARDTDEYNMLLSTISRYEEELRASNGKLLSSEDEIMRLNSELENALVTTDKWKAQLETTKNEVKMMEVDLDVEKRKASELQMQVAMLESKVFDSSSQIETLMEELQLTGKKLGISEAEVSELKRAQYDRDNEIRKLTASLQDALRNAEMEKAWFQSHNSSLSENLTLLEARLAEREMQIKTLENEIRKCEGLYEAQEIRWQGDIEGFKTQLNEKLELVEFLNKSQDGLKLKYDMLMAEKDGLNAKVQALTAELCSRENNIRQVEGHLHKLQSQNGELIVASETALKFRDELGLKVENLEKEVARQAVMISDRAEEKREAIRQLCFSLEHYRSGYQQLRQAYVGQRRHAVIASLSR